MRRFGYAIRIGGDAEIAGALAAGLRAASPSRDRQVLEADEIRTVQDEILRQRTQNAVKNVALHRGLQSDDWKTLIAKAEWDYGEPVYYPTPWEKLVRALELAWCVACYAVRMMTGKE